MGEYTVYINLRSESIYSSRHKHHNSFIHSTDSVFASAIYSKNIDINLTEDPTQIGPATKTAYSDHISTTSSLS